MTLYLDAAGQSASHAVGHALAGASGSHHLQGVKGQITNTTSKQNSSLATLTHHDVLGVDAYWVAHAFQEARHTRDL